MKKKITDEEWRAMSPEWETTFSRDTIESGKRFFDQLNRPKQQVKTRRDVIIEELERYSPLCGHTPEITADRILARLNKKKAPRPIKAEGQVTGQMSDSGPVQGRK